MNNEIDMYAPCPCGSGEKYRFCCHKKKREMSGGGPRQTTSAEPGVFREQLAKLGIPRLDEAVALNENGLRLMNQDKLAAAIPVLREAVRIAPDFFSSANNLALCLFQTGDVKQAVKVQEESLAAARLPNPFGMAQAAFLHYAAGDEKKAEKRLEQACGMAMVSEDALLRVCETLALFKRHRQIIEVADATDYGSNADVCFYTGVASANLDDRERALHDLGKAVLSWRFSNRAKPYRDLLRKNSPPVSVMGDWPYLNPAELLPRILLDKLAAPGKAAEDLSRLPIVVDFCEASLNALPSDADTVVDVISLVKHPASSKLLWALVNGTFGPDAARIRAMQLLQERGEIDPAKPIRLYQKGKWSEVMFQAMKLNEAFVFGGKLPSKLDRRYKAAVADSFSDAPDWDEINKEYLAITEEAPGFFPARFNYAVGLLKSGHDKQEALPILEELVKEQPEYLCAHAALLQCYCMDGREDDARQLVKQTRTPQETHPDALVAWHGALFEFYLMIGEEELAANQIDLIEEINPDHPLVSQLLRD